MPLIARQLSDECYDVYVVFDTDINYNAIRSAYEAAREAAGCSKDAFFTLTSGQFADTIRFWVFDGADLPSSSPMPDEDNVLRQLDTDDSWEEWITIEGSHAVLDKLERVAGFRMGRALLEIDAVYISLHIAHKHAENNIGVFDIILDPQDFPAAGITVVHVPTADLARELAQPAVSVEAEYGSFVLEGSVYTAAHHQKEGPYAGRHLPGFETTGRPSPCNDAQIPNLSDGVVAISHIDLDTIGGVLRAMGGYDSLFAVTPFWELAEFIDVNGAHRLERGHPYARHMNAVWAWLNECRPRLPRDAVESVTAFMRSAGDALDRILLDEDPQLLAAGDAFAVAAADLNTHSLVGSIEDVLIRVSDRFVNHLYAHPAGGVARAVVALNTTMGSVTVSFESPIEGVSAREIVQRLWGPDAGGHDGIAGSPRGRAMTEDDVTLAAREVARALGIGASA